MLGPLYWGLYLMPPVPFPVVGAIAFLLYRAAHSRRLGSPEGPRRERPRAGEARRSGVERARGDR